MRKQKPSGLNIGTSSLLVVFVVLCLVTFSILSLVSANADRRLSEKTAQHTTDYYQASNQAETLLEKIDLALVQSFVASADEAEYFARLPALAQTLGDVALGEDGRSLSYTVPVSQEQELRVTLTVLYRVKAEDPFYRITEWKLRSTGAWEGSGSLSLYGTEQ